MECNIRNIERGIDRKSCYKTKYKNIVIVKLDSRCYSITHYQTGISLGLDRYTSKEKALLNLDDVVIRARNSLKKHNVTLKQYCKQKKIEQINF